VLKRSFFTVGMCLSAGVVFAGGALKYSVTDASGTVERVVEVRHLDGDKIGAIASYTRADGSSSFVEYAVQCAPLSFAYLGIVDYDKPVTPNLLTVRTASDKLLGNTARPIKMLLLDDETNETSVKALARAICT